MFQTDLLVVDFETTGLDPNKHDPIQIGALLLDKDTLEEKASYCSYIRPTVPERLWHFAQSYARQVNGISMDAIMDAPEQVTVLTRMCETLFPEQAPRPLDVDDPTEFPVFPEKYDVLLTGQNIKFDYGFLLQITQRVGKRDLFGYHTLELSTIHEFVKAITGIQTSGRSLVNQAEFFGLDTSGAHDALFDCKLTAEVLRRWVGFMQERLARESL